MHGFFAHLMANINTLKILFFLWLIIQVFPVIIVPAFLNKAVIVEQFRVLALAVILIFLLCWLNIGINLSVQRSLMFSLIFLVAVDFFILLPNVIKKFKKTKRTN